MKTKRYIFVTAFTMTAWFGVNVAKAQQGYYSAGDTIRGNGFTYICETPWAEEGEILFVSSDDIRLRSINNVFTGMGQKVGGAPAPQIDPPRTWISKDNAFKKFHEIFNTILSSAEKQYAKDDVLMVEIHVSPSTGKIVDVEFWFKIDSGFARIPPGKYFQAEKLLKQQVTFQITAIGRSYNYIFDFWDYKGAFFGQTIP